MFFAVVIVVGISLAGHSANARLVDPLDGPRTRAGAIECSRPFVDVDGDGLASRQEVQRAHYMALGRFRHVLAALEWFAKKIPLVHIESVDEIMNDCDYDKDGFISNDDYEKTPNSCLNNQRKIEQVFDWICVPGAEGKFQYFQEHDTARVETTPEEIVEAANEEIALQKALDQQAIAEQAPQE